jgi:cell division protein FtsL
MTAQAIPFRRRRARATNSRTYERGPRIFSLSLFIIAVVAVFFGMIFLRISLDETAFELAELEVGIQAEESRQLDLRYDLAFLKDPQRIAKEAERIGLVYPDDRVTIVLDRMGSNAPVLEDEIPVQAMIVPRP